MIRPSNSRPIRSFKEFLEHGGEPEVLCKSKIYIEDISGSQKRTKIKELEQLRFQFFPPTPTVSR